MANSGSEYIPFSSILLENLKFLTCMDLTIISSKSDAALMLPEKSPIACDCAAPLTSAATPRSHRDDVVEREEAALRVALLHS